MQRIAPLSAVLIVFFASGPARADHHKEWMKFLEGNWEFTWTTEPGEFEWEGETEVSLTGNGDAVVLAIDSTSGSEIELIGWQAQRATIVATAHGANGGHRFVEYTEISKDKLVGEGTGELGDGRFWRSKVTWTKTGPDSYEVHVNGEVDGEKTVTVGKYTRKKEGIPAEARKALAFFVGRYQSKQYLNGEQVGSSKGERKWLPGQHSVVMTHKLVEKGVTISMTGISGWDAKGKQVVETWHDSDGFFVTIRYPLAKMQQDKWMGNILVVDGNGSSFESECVLHIQDDGWVWGAHWEEDGKRMERKVVTHRLVQ